MSGHQGFSLHARLERDCRVLGDLRLNRVLLMDDCRFPWCILVPRRPGLTELHHLPGADRGTLFDELEAVSQALLTVPGVSKLNVAALGNLVPQLHLHVVARHLDDAAWPGPVWGHGRAIAYPADALAELSTQLKRELRLG